MTRRSMRRNVIAWVIATGEIEDTTLKQPAKRASGLAGAKARQENTTVEQRQEIARKAANARWE